MQPLSEVLANLVDSLERENNAHTEAEKIGKPCTRICTGIYCSVFRCAIIAQGYKERCVVMCVPSADSGLL